MAKRPFNAALAAVAALFGLLIPGTASAGSTFQPKLINAEAPTEDYQFHAAMLYKDQGVRPTPLRCSGALIRPQWIVTAAHCIKGHNPGNYWFSIGSNNYRLGTMMEAVEFLPHPEYDSANHPLFADIALVRLGSPATQTPISVSPPPDDRGGAVRMIGWGRTVDGDAASIPDVARQLDTQLQPSQNCDFDDPYDAAAGDLCVKRAKNATAGACNGDSGSPLLYRANSRWIAVAVDSRSGGEDGCLNTDEVYVSIFYHWNWIMRTFERYQES